MKIKLTLIAALGLLFAVDMAYVSHWKVTARQNVYQSVLDDIKKLSMLA